MCVFALSVSAQGFCSKMGSKTLKQIERYKYEWIGAASMQLARMQRNQYYQNKLGRNVPIVANDSCAVRSATVGSEYMKESEKGVNTTSSKRMEAEEGLSFIMVLLLCLGGMFSLCIICIIVASYLEKRQSKVLSNTPERFFSTNNQWNKQIYIYLANGGGVILCS